MDQIAAKLLSSQYLNELKFAPITNVVNIKGSRINIPQMEVQSTGLNFFVEGHVDNKNKTNVWLSIPFGNLKRTERDTVPLKRSYAASRRKMFLEITNDEGDLKTKFRVSKRKYYKQRGILDQFKKDKKRWKSERKALKKRNKD